MAVDKVLIGNLALSHIGARSKIESLTEKSPEAQQINLWFVHSLTTALEYGDWSFARTRRSLATDEDSAPLNEWLFRYAYPASCVKLRYLEQPLYFPQNSAYWERNSLDFVTPDAVPFTVEISEDKQRKTILTNLEQARAVFTFYHENFNLMTPHFINGMSMILGGNIAMAVTGKPGIKEKMYTDGLRELAVACSHDANERREEPPRDTDWIRARV